MAGFEGCQLTKCLFSHPSNGDNDSAQRNSLHRCTQDHSYPAFQTGTGTWQGLKAFKDFTLNLTQPYSIPCPARPHCAPCRCLEPRPQLLALATSGFITLHQDTPTLSTHCISLRTFPGKKKKSPKELAALSEQLQGDRRGLMSGAPKGSRTVHSCSGLSKPLGLTVQAGLSSAPALHPLSASPRATSYPLWPQVPCLHKKSPGAGIYGSTPQGTLAGTGLYGLFRLEALGDLIC